MADKRTAHGRFRKAVQALWGLLTNAHLSGFFTGQIYSGKLKQFCVPGMNCYACPGALGACPIGSMQAMFSARRPKFAAYIIGYLTVIGVLAGRFICGWLCLFGLIQELLYRIPVKKLTIPPAADRILRKAKYVILAVFVVILPFVLRDEFRVSYPYFCKWICPVGTLEAGIPLVALNESLRSAVHFLYAWKMMVLAFILLLCVIIQRPFCKYICPLGAFYSLFQKISFLQISLDTSACVHCGACEKSCGMNVDPSTTPNSMECIRCGDCIHSCHTHALKFTFSGKPDYGRTSEKRI